MTDAPHTALPPTPGKTASDRLIGLDALRFVAAMWVVLMHYGVPPLLAHAEGEGPLGKALASILGVCFNGPAAVVVFFVISGLCIHFPQRRGARLDLPIYYGRRYIRIGIPMLAAIALAAAVPGGLDAVRGVLWSLYCELIYYTIYPLLLAAARRWSWHAVLAAALAASAAAMVAVPGVQFFWAYGVGLTWLVALPLWILGCQLAEADWSAFRIPSAVQMWSWRAAFLALTMAQLVVQFHTAYGQVWTLMLCGFAAKAWIAREIAWSRANPPLGWLEAIGAWSYSLYLCHAIAAVLVPVHGRAGLAANESWLLLLACGLGMSYAFYLLVERPSHLLARNLRRAKAARATAIAPPPSATTLEPVITPGSGLTPPGPG